MASNQPEKLYGHDERIEQQAMRQRDEAAGTQIPPAKFLNGRGIPMMERITSRTNPLMTHIRKLAASRSYRAKTGEYLGDGTKLLEEALTWGAAVTTVVYTAAAALPPLPPGIRAVEVPEDVMKSVSPMEAPQGALFLAREPDTALPEKLSGSREKGTYRDIGIPWRKEGGEGAFGRGKLLAKGLLRQTGSLEEIFPDVWTVSGIRAVVPEEPVPEQFFLRRGDMLVPDLMEDEQLLVFHTPEGLAVFAGCAHLGILNCLERVKEVFPGKRLWLLLAGMHLRGCSRQRLEASVEGLRRCGFSWIIPLHCTGMEAIVEMRKAFGKHCLPGDAGRRYEL